MCVFNTFLSTDYVSMSSNYSFSSSCKLLYVHSTILAYLHVFQEGCLLLFLVIFGRYHNCLHIKSCYLQIMTISFLPLTSLHAFLNLTNTSAFNLLFLSYQIVNFSKEVRASLSQLLLNLEKTWKFLHFFVL